MVSTLSEQKKNTRLMQMKQGEYIFRKKIRLKKEENGEYDFGKEKKIIKKIIKKYY